MNRAVCANEKLARTHVYERAGSLSTERVHHRGVEHAANQLRRLQITPAEFGAHWFVVLMLMGRALVSCERGGPPSAPSVRGGYTPYRITRRLVGERRTAERVKGTGHRVSIRFTFALDTKMHG